MNLPASAISRKLLTYFISVLIVVGGIVSYFVLGQLEDPDYTIKQVVVLIPYPGASPEQVEREVTEKVERKLQELGQIYYIRSMSRPGLAHIDVMILPKFTSSKMPQVKDEVRRKVYDIADQLPPGAGPPIINDDFGQVFGFLVALVGEDYSYGDLEAKAKIMQRDLSLVKGASRVDLWGIQKRAIYLDITQAQMVTMGLSPQTVINTLNKQNLVVDAGGIDNGQRRFRIQTAGAFKEPDDIKELTFRPSPLDRFNVSTSDSDDLIRLGDVAEVKMGYQTPPQAIMRFNGERALGIAIAAIEGSNVVHLGQRLDEEIARIEKTLPVGMRIEKIAWQSDLVTEAIRNFLISLGEAVLIVLVVLWFAMGKENALIVGTALVLTVLATFILMAVAGIDLQRMSLGALVIALGMMVDNAIVVADGASVRIDKGMDPIKASIEAAAGPAWPLLGATIIAVSFFFPIYLSTEGAGEFCASLFQVVAMSLLLSWLISMTITPLQCSSLLRQGKESKTEGDGPIIGLYRRFLRFAMRRRYLTIGVAVALLCATVVVFRWVPQMFFPDASRLQFMVDYWAPEGARIQETEADLRKLEKAAMGHPGVANVASFIGGGPPRFYLPVEPERPYASYAQMLVNIKDLKYREELLSQLDVWAKKHVPEALVRGRQFSVGPGKPFKFEARFSGPADADITELRGIGAEAVAILKKSPLAKDVRIDWRQRVPRLTLQYNQARGRWTGVTRADIGDAARRSFDGLPIGIYRDAEELIPIMIRQSDIEDEQANLDAIQVIPDRETEAVPMAQVADTVYDWEDPFIWRRDRKRTVTVQAEPTGGTLSELMRDVADKVLAIKLPPGYSMEWGGEIEESAKSQASLIPGLVPVVLLVPIVLVALFNRKTTPIIVILLIPFGLVGVVFGLFFSGVPFGFMALLGSMSLAGMMIKNAIVLVDEIRDQQASGKKPYDAVEGAAVARLRPVAMAAATTILGVIPLLQDVFWISMAVVIMGGLAVGTVVTMILLPVLYVTFYRIQSPENAGV